MRRSATLLMIAQITLAAGCGDSSSQPDASMIDAGPALRLDVVVGTDTVCPDGWTTGPSAIDEPEANRIVIRGGCSTDINEVELHYAPHAEAGGTAPCIQSTIQINGGAKAKCRINNEVLMAPEGMLTVTADGLVQGECACLGEDGATMGGVDFLLKLE